MPILFNDHLSSWSGLASETAVCYFVELNHTVFGCVNGELLAHKSAWAGKFSLADLAHNNFACADFLAPKALNTKSLAG
jgi:hypothetical protein